MGNWMIDQIVRWLRTADEDQIRIIYAFVRGLLQKQA